MILVQPIETMVEEIDKQRENVTRSLSVLNNLAQDNAAVSYDGGTVQCGG